MTRARRVGRHAVWLAGLLTVAAACWICAFFAVRWGLAHLGWDLVGLVFLIAPLIAIGVAMQPAREALMQSSLAALHRISRGNYSARVEAPDADQRNPFTRGRHDQLHAMELDRTERMRQEFVSNVSHELQSPLTSIGGFARLLLDQDMDDAERRHYLEIILTESERLSGLSDNLLKLTSLEGDRPALACRPYRLDRQLRRVLMAAEPQWTAKGLAVDVALAPVQVDADQGLLDQTWMNLVCNAIKFTPAGGCIGVRLDHGEGGARVAVTDTGVGVAPEDQPRIFERFFKADPARNREAGGSGLGPALVKKIVELHGGTVGVQSALGRGSTFVVTLPAGPRIPAVGGDTV